MSSANDRAHWRSPALGTRSTLELPSGRIAYHDVGAGPPIVFVHGLLVNANLWRKVVERLAPDFRCIALDLPLGSHTLPLAGGTPTGAQQVAAMVADAIEALGLEDVTLVGNDTGGSLCQIVVTTRPERIGRLVLTSCDYRDNFPPKIFAYFRPAAAIPGMMWALLQSMRLPLSRRSPMAFGWIVKRPIERAAEDSYVYAAMGSRQVRNDVRAFIRGASTADTNAAADRLGGFEAPALIAWSAEDKVFPESDGRALAADLPNSRFELVEDARTFSMEDNPERVAELIRGFVRETAGAAA